MPNSPPSTSPATPSTAIGTILSNLVQSARHDRTDLVIYGQVLTGAAPYGRAGMLAGMERQAYQELVMGTLR
jgi:hypothetical protein